MLALFRLIFLEKRKEATPFCPDGLGPLLLRSQQGRGSVAPLGSWTAGEGVSGLAPFLGMLVHQLLVNDPLHIILWQEKERPSIGGTERESCEEMGLTAGVQ